MTTKATRDVIDLETRPVRNFVLDGTGNSSIDSTPIGVSVPDLGCFTNLKAENLRVTGNADFTGATVTGGFEARYADLAEKYESDILLEAGDIVKIGGSKEVTKTDSTNDFVYGVVSTAPAIVMNSNDKTKCHWWFPIALKGRVPCKVRGEVKKGDFLKASEQAGVACKCKSKLDAFAIALEDGDTLVEVALV